MFGTVPALVTPVAKLQMTSNIYTTNNFPFLTPVTVWREGREKIVGLIKPEIHKADQYTFNFWHIGITEYIRIWISLGNYITAILEVNKQT